MWMTKKTTLFCKIRAEEKKANKQNKTKEKKTNIDQCRNTFAFKEKKNTLY